MALDEKTKKTKYKKTLKKTVEGKKNITYNAIGAADSISAHAGAGKMFSAFGRIGEEALNEVLRIRPKKGKLN